jgi:hypothetical protein
MEPHPMSYTPIARAVVRATLALAVVGMVFAALAPGAASSQDRHVVYLPALRNAGDPPAQPPPPAESALSITVAPDAARAVSAPVGPEGGQLSATGADGAVYTLSIPAGALAYTQTLTLTPSASVAGLPLSGGALGAAQLAPEGLLLMQAATLTMTPPEIGEEASIYAFGFDGSGAEFHLRGGDAVAPQGAELAGAKIITIRAPRLRGYGAGKGTPADVTRYRARHRPTRVADQIVEDDLFAPLPTYKEWLQEKQHQMAAILAMLDQARSKPEAIEEAVVAYVEWDYRVTQHPNGTDLAPERAEFRERLRQAVQAASAGAAERCRNDHSLADGLRLQRWLYYLYTYALPMDPSYLEALVIECLSFDLEVKASFVRSSRLGNDEVKVEAQVESRIPLKPRLNYPLFSLAGQGDLTVKHASYSSSDEACWEQFTPATAHPMRVIDVSIVTDSGDGFAVDSILFAPGKGIWGTVTWACGESGPFSIDYNYLYAAEFSMMHSDEMHGGANSEVFRLPIWQRSIGDQVATTGTAYVRSKDLPDPAANTWHVVEDTTFTLIHRP